MLRVDREHLGAFLRGPAHEQAAGADEAFLVGQRDHAAPLDRGERRLEPGCAGDCRHDPIGRTLGGFDQGTWTRCGLDPAPRKILLEVPIRAGIGYRGETGVELARDPS